MNTKIIIPNLLLLLACGAPCGSLVFNDDAGLPGPATYCVTAGAGDYPQGGFWNSCNSSQPWSWVDNNGNTISCTVAATNPTFECPSAFPCYVGAVEGRCFSVPAGE